MLTAGAFADTVTLKSGEHIEATVASETATEMTLDIQISAGITDQRVVKKADVAKVDRVAPDESAYRAIMNLLPGKNSLLAAQYPPIVSALQSFAAQYPESSHIKDVQAALKGFQADKARVDAGEIKFDGIWLSKSDAQKHRVQIGGMLTFNAMKTANAAGDPVGALNSFTVLEKSFPGAKVMPDAIELARQIVGALKPAAERAIANYKINESERLLGLKNAGTSGIDGTDPSKPIPENLREQARVTATLAAARQNELIAAHQRDQAKADAALATAAAANLWPPFLPNSEKALTAIVAKAVPEAARLEKIPVAPMRESLKLAEKAQTEFTAKDYIAATETLKEVTKLWPTNEMGLRITAQIAEAKNPPKPDPTLAAVPATGTPVKPGSPTAAPQPGAATPAPGAATPAPGTATTPGAPVPAATPVAKVTTPDAPEGAEKPAEEPEKPFFMTLGGAITIVIGLAVLLGVLNVFNKVRRRANETLE